MENSCNWQAIESEFQKKKRSETRPAMLSSKLIITVRYDHARTSAILVQYCILAIPGP